MTTDEEKQKIAKLLQNIEIPEVKLSERCSGLVKELHQKFGKEIEGEEYEERMSEYVNPYVVDPRLLEETDRNLRLLQLDKKRKKPSTGSNEIKTPDPQKPWRTNSNKEQLLRIDSDLKRHLEKASELTMPLSKDAMEDLIKECQNQPDAQPVTRAKLRETVEAAKKNLPNFQYQKIDNTTATTILQDAHLINTTTSH